ncbi:MAG TPA: lysylphosphatidylglycerol synthase transmembrane domain-containing protein [Chloroflexota bacterium]|nr:lysylphosphatidylglycerol synthase transmembrane domain-containing protein [Chloroflexota bacterium]
MGCRRGAIAQRRPRVSVRGVNGIGRLTRGVIIVATLAIGVAAVVVAWGDAPAVFGALGRFPPLLLLPVVLLTVWNYGLRFARWQYFLRVLGVTGVTTADSALVFLSGFAMGLTPGKSGEVTKSYWLRELAGPGRAPLARTAPMVFAERLVDGIAMLILASSGLVSFRFGVGALLAVAALAVLAVGLLQARPLVHGILKMLRGRARTARAAVVIETLYESARELLTWPRLVLAVGVGVMSWGGECLALYVILLGLGAAPGLELLNQATFALATGSLVGSASLLPGGIGAAEGTVAAVLDLVAGQPRDVAAAATLLIRVCTLWFGVLLGAAALLLLARRVRL